ncbi:prostate-associated microseminoprotein [Mesocricetus auratus]|uniref:Beta-microseminoprotein n=1 Tax=Mesocricetus auratus TaxID=10036 RepID=A0A1U7QTJ6_MESAU|nr:prostate-associated microseminoprotein [Mesocricetus auratus]
MRKSPTRQKLKSQGVRQEKQRPEEPTKPSRAWESWAAEMALRMLWTGQGKGILGGWRSICLVISLLLQHPGVNSKCYFQAQAPCHHDGKYFTLGESWLRKDCFHCTCLHPVGVGCCDTSQHPIDFPAGCEVRQEAGTCQFSLVQKSDPRLPCKGGGPDLEWGSANTPVPGAPAPHSS